jgi:hypothetical protein
MSIPVIGVLKNLFLPFNKTNPAIAYTAAKIKNPKYDLPTKSPISNAIPILSTIKNIKNTINNAIPATTDEATLDVLSTNFNLYNSSLSVEYSFDLLNKDSIKVKVGCLSIAAV